MKNFLPLRNRRKKRLYLPKWYIPSGIEVYVWGKVKKTYTCHKTSKYSPRRKKKSFFGIKTDFRLIIEMIAKMNRCFKFNSLFQFFVFTVYVCDLDGSSLFHSALISFVCLSMLYVGNKFAVLPLCVFSRRFLYKLLRFEGLIHGRHCSLKSSRVHI